MYRPWYTYIYIFFLNLKKNASLTRSRNQNSAIEKTRFSVSWIRSYNNLIRALQRCCLKNDHISSGEWYLSSKNYLLFHLSTKCTTHSNKPFVQQNLVTVLIKNFHFFLQKRKRMYLSVFGFNDSRERARQNLHIVFL